MGDSPLAEVVELMPAVDRGLVVVRNPKVQGGRIFIICPTLVSRGNHRESNPKLAASDLPRRCKPGR